MSFSDVINAILAGLTFLGIVVALSLGIWSINETKKLQRKQHIERFIEQISQWRLEINRCEADFNFTSETESENAHRDGKSAKNHYSIMAGKISNEMAHLSNKGKMLALTIGVATNPLSSSIRKICDKLSNSSDYHEKYRIAFLNLPNDISEVFALLKEWRDNDPHYKDDEMKEIRGDMNKQLSLLAGNDSFKCLTNKRSK